MINIDIIENKLHISFPYNKEIVEKVRNLPSRKYIPTNHHWTVPLVNINDVMEFAEDLKKDKIPVTISDKVISHLEAIQTNIEKSFSQHSVLNIPKPENLNYRPFQKAGINWIEEKKNVLIGDEMGLGKTVEALGFLNLHPENRPVLIICPASVKYNWETEANKWVLKNNKIYVIKNGKDNIPDDANIVIINYSLVIKHTEALKEKKFQVIIMDESHYIKNKKAQRTQAILEIAKNIPIKIAMTGTPILNRPIELLTTLKLLDPATFSDWYWYVTTFCNGYRSKWGWNVSGASNLEQLNNLLRSTVMIRRMKADVLTELPNKTRTLIPLDTTLSEEYKSIAHNIYNKIKEYQKNKSKEDKNVKIKTSYSSIIFSEVEKLRQEIFENKKEMVLDFILDVLDNKNKLVIFTYYRKSFAYIKSELEKRGIKCVGIIGGMGAKERQEVVKKFQEDDSIQVFIGSIKATAEGITLTKADTVVFTELDWTPSKLKQAEDRLHRISQTNAVNVYYLLAKNSIDMSMYDRIEQKLNIIDKAVNKINENEEESDKSLFDFVLSIFENEDSK